jgi:quercetin 2,3-dioxygenase
MKVHIHKATERGYADYGLVKSFHSFNFADYFNPVREKFGVIRVLNDEVMEPGGMFEMHEHKNLEILIMPLKGELVQVDNHGNKSIIASDEVQIISAGSGIQHSIGNNSGIELAEILQIWLFPKLKNTEPRCQVLQFPDSDRDSKLQKIFSPALISDILWINQNAWLSRIDLKKGNSFEYSLMKNGNYVMVFVIEGSIILQDYIDSDREMNVAMRRDSIEIKELKQNFTITAKSDCSLLFIDAPPD